MSPILADVTGQKWENRNLALGIQWQKSVFRKCAVLTQTQARAEITEGTAGGRRGQFLAYQPERLVGSVSSSLLWIDPPRYLLCSGKVKKKIPVALGLNYAAFFGSGFPKCGSVACRVGSFELSETQLRGRSFKTVQRLFFNLIWGNESLK